jgi:broad specificity phosphatase PhoE
MLPSFEKINPVEKEHGLNIRVKIELLRHGTPGKTENGMSADFLTDTGKEMAATIGANIDDKNIKGYSSNMQRAQETMDLMLDNTDDAVNVINRMRIDKLANFTQRTENVYRIATKDELNPIENFAKIMPEAKEWAKKQKEAGSRSDNLSLIVQYYLDNPDVCVMHGVPTAHEAATQLANRISIELKLTERLKNGSEVRLSNVTHGPKLEAFLKELLNFNSIDTIGGAVKEGEGLSFDVKIDDQGKKTVSLLFRDKKYDLTQDDLQKITSMGELYKESLKRKE